MQSRFEENGLIISDNRMSDWSISSINEVDLIWLRNVNDNDYGSFGLKDIPFIIKTLTEIQNYYNNVPKKNDKVQFIKGRMTELTGTITDIDKCDSKRPLVIRIDDSKEINDCTYFCNYDEVEVMK